MNAEPSSSPLHAEVPLPAVELRSAVEPVLHAAHDIGNVLAALKLRMTLLMNDERCRLAQGRNLEVMRRIIDHGSAITSSLVRRRAGLASAPRTGLAAAIADALEIAGTKRAESGRREVRFVTALPPLPPVFGERDSVTRVFANLFLNACDALGDGGEVTVSAEVADGSVIVTVEDDGPGVPADLAARLFEPGASTKGAGRGLGLSIVAELMADLGGAVELAGGGGGARFVLRFPRG